MATLNQEPQSPYFSSSVSNFLVYSAKFWFSLLLASILLAMGFFSFTDFYTTHYAPLGTPLLSLITSMIIFLHYLLLVSASRKYKCYPLRTAPFSKRVLGLSLGTWALYPSQGIGMALFFYPEYNSVAALCFTMCVAVYTLTYSQILRHPVGFRPVQRQIAFVGLIRAFYLYGVLGALLMCLFNSLLAVVNIVLEYAMDDMKLAENHPQAQAI
ncbi:hypothetical protein LguiA_003897 [Lonicera macranthoides]